MSVSDRVSDSARSPLSVADRVFAMLQRGPAPLAIDPGELFAAHPGADPGADAEAAGLGRAPIPLARLRALLRAPQTGVEVKNRAWSLLVARAQRHGGAWTVGAVGVALGPLVNLATELAGRDQVSRPDLDAEVLAGFLAALATVSPQRPQLFPYLLREARRAGLAWLRRQRAADTPLCPTGFASHVPPAPWGHPDLVLADAVAAGVLTAYEAGLIGATRLEEVCPHTLARREHTGVETIWKRRRRAEHRLLAYLAEHSSDTTPADELDPTVRLALAPVRLAPNPPAPTDTGRARPVRAARGCSTVHRHRCPEPAGRVPSYRCGGTTSSRCGGGTCSPRRARPATRAHPVAGSRPAPTNPATALLTARAGGALGAGGQR